MPGSALEKGQHILCCFTLNRLQIILTSNIVMQSKTTVEEQYDIVDSECQFSRSKTKVHRN